jgi:hypothetical protein
VDIISNRYKERHEDKVRVNDETAKALAAKKYWQTHDFDPVACRFYDAAKEARFQAKKRELDGRHGAGWEMQLPPRARNSEGMTCDIISMQPKAVGGTAGEGVGASAGGVAASNIKQRMERQQQEASVISQSLSETRNLNRNSATRHKHMHGYNNGFDLIDGKPFMGRGGHVKAALRLTEGKSLWQRLEESASFCGTVAMDGHCNSGNSGAGGEGGGSSNKNQQEREQQPRPRPASSAEQEREQQPRPRPASSADHVDSFRVL